MIRDPTVLAQVQAEWASVHSTKDFIARNLAAAGPGIGTIGMSHEFRNFTYCLWLLFAFSVLERVLVELRDEGHFASKKSNLEALMVNSRSALTWQNYCLVDEARNRRNDIAHRRNTFERGDCWRYVDAIETELRAWNVIRP